MNPSDEKEKEKLDSTPMEDIPEPAPTNQETEEPLTQSGGDMSSPAPTNQETEEPLTQSGGDMSSPASSSKTSSLATLQKIAAMFGKGKVPEFIRTQIEGLSKGKMQISESGLPIPDPSDSDSSSEAEDINYFDVFVVNSNCLPIYYEDAGSFFPPFSTKSNTERTLQLTDPLNRQHSMTYIWFDHEDAFILTRNWPQYVEQFNLRLMDRVRFTSPKRTLQPLTPLNPRSQPALHFLTQHFPRQDDKPLHIILPEFLPERFLFQLKLTPLDARFGRLAISREQVLTHFSDLGVITRGKYEMVKFTDYNDKEWFLKIVYSESSRRFMVIDGWEKLAREHELEPGDFVRFYELDTHEMHFLIQFMKRNRGDGESRGGSGGGPDAGQSSGGAGGGTDGGESSGGSKDKVEEGVARESLGTSLGGNSD